MANEDNRRNISVDESRTSSKLPPLQIALLLPDSTRFQTDFERKYSKGNLTDRISARIPQKFSIKQFDWSENKIFIFIKFKYQIKQKILLFFQSISIHKFEKNVGF